MLFRATLDSAAACAPLPGWEVPSLRCSCCRKACFGRRETLTGDPPLTLTRYFLTGKGYHCTAVHNGRVAQDQVKKSTPDLVLSDMIMPEMDGIRLLEWMRQYDPEVPVIMVTAIHDISTALEAIRRGAYDYILKPFEKDQLFLGVGRALQHRRLIIENRNYQRNLEQLVEERTAQLTAKH